ncbi:MAG: DUF177 domain-containing protein [Synergistes sp.]|nr:DUF177 domain-containing protein [Synergistes sp.]
MKKYLEEAPQSWKRHLLPAAVPKDGMPYSDSFALSCDLPISYWGQLYTLLSDVKASAEAYRSDEKIILTVETETEVSAPCTRCLKTAREKVGGMLRYVLLQQGNEKEPAGEEENRSEEEFVTVDSWEEEISLIPMVWETLITSLPYTLLCRPDCRGLCPQCGADLNEGDCGCSGRVKDPRFDVLKNFIQEETDNTAKNQN